MKNVRTFFLPRDIRNQQNLFWKTKYLSDIFFMKSIIDITMLNELN